ncbi:PEP-CTERM sorting domain-containing protein [Roseateles oligotrophus]|uniref:PEP-CTERM sorting domain-containing protein n=1 Tax=Roseateles oligotrophus TaxID=1769250 RepID=A0ABT2YCZ6_9BURK|nr:PEP-CTERM sorting domain-containing protein [Roseateles oligotrophus]MCV2367923.1 PEP-CTERM sorting domain-containing protein [Roseateles oligotrophus]
MPTFKKTAGQLMLGLCAALALAAQAGPSPVNLFFDGAGTQPAIDAAQGTGLWSGSIKPGFGSDVTESLLSNVLFKLDASTNTLSGSFEFSSLDLASSISGLLTGSDLDGDGQFEIDYQILGGSGAFSRASGYGLSFISFDQPLTMAGSYTESGLLSFAVPEPSSYGLLGLALLGVALTRRKPVGTALRG